MTEIKLKYLYDPKVPEHFVRGDTFLEAFPKFSGIVVEYDADKDFYQMIAIKNGDLIEKNKYYLLVVERSSYEKN